MIGSHDNLNENDPIRIPVDIDHLAKRIADMNYGVHRMLCALTRAVHNNISLNGRKSKFSDELLADLEKICEDHG